MARHAGRLGVEALVEPAARTTGENVAFSLPLVEDLPRIAFVSDPLHALRARRLAAAQRPELAGRLVAGECYRPFERWWWKLGCAAYEGVLAGRVAIDARALPLRPVVPLQGPAGRPVGGAG